MLVVSNLWLLYLLSILLSAFSDGEHYKMKKVDLFREKGSVDKRGVKKHGIFYHTSKLVKELLLLGVITVLVTGSSYIDLVVCFFMYTLLRFSLYDIIYNLVIGKDIRKIGTTSVYDLVLNFLFAKNKEFLIFLRSMAFIASGLLSVYSFEVFIYIYNVCKYIFSAF